MEAIIIWFFKSVVMPYFATIIVDMIRAINEKSVENAEKKEIHDKVEKYKETTTPEEQEQAFLEIIRAARARR